MEKIYFRRYLEQKLLDLSGYFPATVLIGPRQVGKTSLVHSLRNQLAQHSIYLDLERPEDLGALENLEAFAENYPDSLLILDEVQRKPRLFPELRSVIDRNRTPGRFLLLGSASFDLIRDASETLAGRVAIEELGGLRLDELGDHADFLTRWLRGGYPDSLLAPSDAMSVLWRENLLRTYLERDILSFVNRLNPIVLRRLLTMISHLSGNLLNVEQLSNSLQIDRRTVEGYLSLLEQTFVIRRLPAYHANLGKRLIKKPKIYIRDTGILHTLLGIEDYIQLTRHPVMGASFETYVLENVCSYARQNRYQVYYYRTRNGNELDIVLERGSTVTHVIEIKASPNPKLSKGFYSARSDLGNPPAYVICHMTGPPYSPQDGITILGPRDVPILFS